MVSVACALIIALLVRPAEGALRLLAITVDPVVAVSFLGRALVLTPTNQPALLMLFLMALVVFLFAPAAKPEDIFYPLGLLIIGLFGISLIVRPLPYAAFTWQIAATVAVFLIQSQRVGERSGQAALRYLSTATFTLPLFLLAGWLSDRVSQFSTQEAALLAQNYSTSAALIMVAVVLLLGGVPLYSWLHLVARDAQPPVIALLGALATGAAQLLWLDLWEANFWLRDSALVNDALRALGVVMLVIAALTGWAQMSFSRWLGSALIAEIGTGLLLMRPLSLLEVEAQVVSMAGRALALIVFAIGLQRLRAQCGGDTFDALRTRPDRWTIVALVAGGLSLAGAPTTVGFVSRWLVARALGDSEIALLLALSGVSLLAGLVRGMRTALGASREVQETASPPAVIQAARGARIAVSLAAVLIFALGLAPAILVNLAAHVADAYTFYP